MYQQTEDRQTLVNGPHCDSDYSHIHGVGTLTGTDPFEAAQAYAGTVSFGQTQSRRSATEVICCCEGCQRLFSLVLQQHKGNNFLETCPDPAGDLRLLHPASCHQCGQPASDFVT